MRTRPSRMKPDPTAASEPTVALLERRLAAMHQDKTFRPTLPWWSVFTAEELQRLKAPEET